MVGRKIRNNFNTIPGRKPEMSDLTKALHYETEDYK
jgi:hypothetical protein